MTKQGLQLLGGAAAGAGLMYLLDPQSGRRRRSLLRDQLVHTRKVTGEALEKAKRDAGNRTHGAAARVGSVLRRREVTDEQLAARVRSKLGHVVSHPSAIEVTAEDGRVTLAGPVLADEVKGLLRAVAKVPGVKDVDDRLDVHEQPDVPALQGGDGQAVRSSAGGSWKPATRLVIGASGGALAAYGLAKRDKVGAAVGTVGLGLLTRSVTNFPANRLIGRGDGSRGSEAAQGEDRS
jgi:osmotically-inducible protein OsmY